MKNLIDTSFEKQIERYLNAKSAYYEGREVMSDADFDQLEAEIREQAPDHPALSVVGYSSNRFQFAHWSPMLSLEKIQVNDEIDQEYQSILKWIEQTHSDNHFVIQPKYDGNSLSAQYRSGKLIRVLTRGDGVYGFDVTEKVKHALPETIKISDPVEIRGECLISIDLFQQINQNGTFKNERNFVAGVLSDSKESTHERSLSFVAFGINGISFPYYHEQLIYLQKAGFECAHFWEQTLNNLPSIETFHQKMKQYRQESSYRLDGYVIKVDATEQRQRLGENKHHPLSEIAIKFAAQKAETVIQSIEWSISAHRELIPTAQLKPVYLDGSMVSRAYLTNLKNAINHNYLPHSKVQIEKKGDIIPQITMLIEGAVYQQEDLDQLIPQSCPYCMSDLSISEDLTHIYCNNIHCSEVVIKRMSKALKYLKVKNIGPAMVRTLYQAGIKEPLSLFNRSLTQKRLIETGYFKEGRQLERLFESIRAIHTINLDELITIQQIEGVGTTISKMIARYYAGLSYNFSGFEKQVIEELIEKKEYYYKTLPNIWEQQTGITIIYPQLEKTDVEMIQVVLTGSPKSAGYPTKKHFLDRFTHLKEVKKLKEATYLITNDLTSTSKKMRDAQKLGKEIRTYKSFEDDTL